MEITIIVITNIIFLITHIAIKHKLKKAKILTRSTSRALNGTLIAMFVGYILLNYLLLYNVAREQYFDPTMATVIVTATFNLIPSPYFWWASIHFLAKTLLYTHVNMKARFTGHREYNREHLSKVHPGLLALLYDFRVGERDDITAVLLKLKFEGYIEEENGSLVATNKSAENLLESEKQLLAAVKHKTFDVKRYAETVKKEAQARRLISGAGDSEAVKFAKVFLSCALPFAVIIAILTLVGYIAITYSQPREVSWRGSKFAVEVSEDVYNELRRSGIREMSNPTGVYNSKTDKYYIRADLLGGHHAILGDRDTQAVVLGLCAILGPYMIILAISMTSSQVKSFKYDFKRTGAGYKLINDAIGLKNFLKDFTVIGTRSEDEVVIWEYYLIYAVVLELNVTPEDKLITAFLDSI